MHVLLDRPVSESFVADVWEQQAFQRDAFDALGIHLIFRGVPSDAGGPDYQDCLIAAPGGELVRGDVELHVFASDWYRHGHDRAARYNNVILHVVWRSDVAHTLRADGISVPTLALERWCSAPAPTPTDLHPSLLSHPCVLAYRRTSHAALLAAIQQLGQEQMEERAGRFAAEFTAQDGDQVAYAAILESMGFASNRQVFRDLADVAPYAWVMGLPREQRAAALLAAGGLTESSNLEVPASLSQQAWRLTRLRPANHPVRRLRGVAMLLERFEPAILGGLSDAVGRSSKATALRRALTASEGDETYIGSGRADEMAVSVALPLCAAVQTSEEAAHRLYELYPSPPQNRWTRAMIGLLAEAGHEINVKRATTHQGLHRLYHRHCRFERQSGCPVCGRR